MTSNIPGKNPAINTGHTPGMLANITADTALLPDGWHDNVAVTIASDGHIVSVETNHEKPADIHVSHLLPAPVNVHSHSFQRAMAGMTEHRGEQPSDSFWTWRTLMFRFLDSLTPQHIEAIAAFTQMEMLEAGYATNVEFHYLHHGPGGVPYDNLSELADRIINATMQTGIGLTFLPVHYQYGGCDFRQLTQGQNRFYNDLDRFAALCDATKNGLAALPSDTVFGVAPHSLRAVAPDSFAHSREICGGGPFHMHLAEQRAEVDEVVAHLGARPVEWVLDNIEVDSQCCFIHCTQMQPDETIGLAKTGAIAGLCPITEANLGDGIFDGVNWLDAGGKIAFGSDSNISISLAEEMRSLEYSQRLRDHSRAALATNDKSAGRRIFDEICTGGAIAAGRRTGRIEAGYLADMVALDGHTIELTGRSGDMILDSFMVAAGKQMVSNVWAAGRHVVANGKHRHHDAITAAYRTAILSLQDTI